MNVIFFGTPQFSVPSLTTLLAVPNVSIRAVVTQPDRPAGRGDKIQSSPIKQLALQHQITVLQPTSHKKELPLFLESLQELGPFDVGVVIAFGQILPKAVLDLPQHGCINIHASLLPRWRGAAPIQRAILSGDHETGVCLMRMDEGLDTGAIYSRQSVPILATDTCQTIHDSLADIGAKLLCSDLNAIIEGRSTPVEQPNIGITYANKIAASEGLINWSTSSREIALTVRAFSPRPGCFTFWRGERLKILLAHESTFSSETIATPGSVISIHGGYLEVACGSGSLLIEQLQVAGKRQMSTAEFLRGTVLSPGERFNPEALQP